MRTRGSYGQLVGGKTLAWSDVIPAKCRSTPSYSERMKRKKEREDLRRIKSVAQEEEIAHLVYTAREMIQEWCISYGHGAGAALSKATGQRPSVISSMRNGRKTPRSNLISMIKFLLSVTPGFDYKLGMTDDPPTPVASA